MTTQTKQPAPCSVCTKRTEKECAHVDCPNRRRITANVVGSDVATNGRDSRGRSVGGYATVRKPYYFDD